MSDATFPLWPGKFVNPKFRQYQSNRNNKKFNCCLGIQSEMAVRICILHLKPFKITWKPNSDVNFPLWLVKSVNPHFLQKQLQIYLLFRKSVKNGCNNLYFHPYPFDVSYKSFSYLTSLSHRDPVNLSTLFRQHQFHRNNDKFTRCLEI